MLTWTYLIYFFSGLFSFRGTFRTSLSNLPALKWVFLRAGTYIISPERGFRAFGFGLVFLTSNTPKSRISIRTSGFASQSISLRTVNIASTNFSVVYIFSLRTLAVRFATSFFVTVFMWTPYMIRSIKIGLNFLIFINLIYKKPQCKKKNCLSSLNY